jgi:hypothetical protein
MLLAPHCQQPLRRRPHTLAARRQRKHQHTCSVLSTSGRADCWYTSACALSWSYTLSNVNLRAHTQRANTVTGVRVVVGCVGRSAAQQRRAEMFGGCARRVPRQLRTPTHTHNTVYSNHFLVSQQSYTHTPQRHPSTRL